MYIRTFSFNCNSYDIKFLNETVLVYQGLNFSIEIRIDIDKLLIQAAVLSIQKGSQQISWVCLFMGLLTVAWTEGRVLSIIPTVETTTNMKEMKETAFYMCSMKYIFMKKKFVESNQKKH